VKSLLAVFLVVLLTAYAPQGKSADTELMLSDFAWQEQFLSLKERLELIKVGVIHCKIDEQAWRDLVFKWGEIYVHQLGPVETPEYSVGIMLWPDRKGFVTRAVKRYSPDPTIAFDQQSIAIRGLTALDKIIAKQLDTPRFCELANLIIDDLAKRSELAADTSIDQYYETQDAFERAQHRSMSAMIAWLQESLIPAVKSAEAPRGPFDATDMSAVFLAGCLTGISSQYALYWEDKVDDLWPVVGEELRFITKTVALMGAKATALDAQQVEKAQRQLQRLGAIWSEQITADQFVGFNSRDGD